MHYYEEKYLLFFFFLSEKLLWVIHVNSQEPQVVQHKLIQTRLSGDDFNQPPLFFCQGEHAIIGFCHMNFLVVVFVFLVLVKNRVTYQDSIGGINLLLCLHHYQDNGFNTYCVTEIFLGKRTCYMWQERIWALELMGTSLSCSISQWCDLRLNRLYILQLRLYILQV